MIQGYPENVERPKPQTACLVDAANSDVVQVLCPPLESTPPTFPTTLPRRSPVKPKERPPAAVAAAVSAQVDQTELGSESPKGNAVVITPVPKRKRNQTGRKRNRDNDKRDPRSACPENCIDDEGNRPCKAAKKALAIRAAQRALGETVKGGLPHDPACPNRRANRAKAARSSPDPGADPK